MNQYSITSGNLSDRKVIFHGNGYALDNVVTIQLSNTEILTWQPIDQYSQLGQLRELISDKEFYDLIKDCKLDQYLYNLGAIYFQNRRHMRTGFRMVNSSQDEKYLVIYALEEMNPDHYVAELEGVWKVSDNPSVMSK